MLDHIRPQDLPGLQTGLRHRPVQQLPSGTHERLACLVLLVARLLAQHHHFGAGRAFAAEDWDVARDLFADSALAKDFPAFLTLPAYAALLAAESR